MSGGAWLGMRWQGGDEDRQDDLAGVLEDLELQAAGLHLADRAAEVDELSIAQYAEIELLARLLASIGRNVRMGTSGPDVAGRLAAAGADWVQVDDETGATWVVQLRHVVLVAGLADGAVPGQARPVEARLSLRSVLRNLAEDGVSPTWHLSDGRVVHGEPVRVGADFVELRADGAGGSVTVPLTAVVALRVRS